MCPIRGKLSRCPIRGNMKIKMYDCNSKLFGVFLVFLFANVGKST